MTHAGREAARAYLERFKVSHIAGLEIDLERRIVEQRYPTPSAAAVREYSEARSALIETLEREQAERLRIAADIIALLDDDSIGDMERTVLRARYIAGKTADEIAAVTNYSRRQICYYLAAGLDKVGAILTARKDCTPLHIA